MRAIVAVLLAVGGFAWMSTALWPKFTAVWPFVPEAQASAFVGGIVAVFGLALLVRARRAVVILVVLFVLAALVPRVGTLHWFGPEPQVRVMALNTSAGAADTDDLADALRDLNPDVLSLEETTPQEIQRVTAATGFVAMSHAQPGDGYDGVVLLANPRGRLGSLVATAQKISPSSDPKAQHEYVNLSTDARLTRFQMPTMSVPSWHADGSRAGAVAEVPVQFTGVHAVAPLGAKDRKAWDTELARMAEWSGKEFLRTDMVLMGDFNATRWHPRMRDFNKLKDCTGYAAARPTWPSVAPVIRLDHILTTGKCGDAGVVRVSGTDHLGVWADISFRARK